MAKRKLTKEGQIAKQIIDSVNNFDIDLDDIGMYIAQASSFVLYNRLETVMDSARDYREYDKSLDNDRHQESIREIGLRQ